MRTGILCLLMILVYYKSADAQTVRYSMLDSSFGDDGVVKYFDPNLEIKRPLRYSIQKLAMQRNKILAAGTLVNLYGSNTHYDSNIIFRLNSNGTLDKTFGKNGIVVVGYPNIKGNIFGLACQGDGKIVGLFSGYTYDVPDHMNLYALFRLNIDGSFDTTFGKGGFVRVPNDPQAMLLLPGDDIVLAGVKFFDVKRGYIISKFTKDGKEIARDSLMLPDNYRYTEKILLRLNNDNRIVMMVQAYHGRPQFMFVLKYDTSLRLDSSFGRNGIYSFQIPKNDDGSVNEWASFTIQRSGAMVIAFDNTYYGRHVLLRIKNNGGTDNSFGQNGMVTIAHENYINLYTQTLQTQADDKVLVLSNSFTRGIIVERITKNGVIDSTFGCYGVSYKDIHILEDPAFCNSNDMILQPDGKIVVGSDASYDFYFGSVAPIVVRYLPENPAAFASVKRAASVSKNVIKGFIVSPNPVISYLTINCATLSYKNISVINASGTIVLKNAFAGKQHVMNVSSLTAGVYYVRIMETNGSSTSVKMVKQ